MNRLRNLAVLAVALVLTNSAGAAEKGKKKVKPVKGTVVEVTKDQDKDSGSIVVRVAANKKTGVPATDKAVKVTETTKVFLVGGKKTANTSPVPAKFSDVQKGARVVVTAKGDEASEIKIVAKKKKKNEQ
jgi:hypothetical protein